MEPVVTVQGNQYHSQLSAAAEVAQSLVAGEDGCVSPQNAFASIKSAKIPQTQKGQYLIDMCTQMFTVLTFLLLTSVICCF